MSKSSSKSRTVKTKASSIKIAKPKRKYVKKNSKDIQAAKNIKRRFRWREQETIKYCAFISQNEEILSKNFKHQKQKIYNKMEKHIGSRNKEQCKSHHQKMLKRFKSIANILLHLSGIPKKNNMISMNMEDLTLNEMKNSEYETLRMQKLKDIEMFYQESESIIRQTNRISEQSDSQESQTSKEQSIIDYDQYINQMVTFSSHSCDIQECFEEEQI